MQKHHGLYLRMNHITQEGLDTGGKIGNIVGSRTVSNEMTRLSNENARNVMEAIREALENEWLIVVIIYDYTTIHTGCLKKLFDV